MCYMYLLWVFLMYWRPIIGVIITCAEGQGLLFSQISGLLLKDVTISECGAQGEALNESINIVYDQIEFIVCISPFIRIAIFMGLCQDVVMHGECYSHEYYGNWTSWSEYSWPIATAWC